MRSVLSSPHAPLSRIERLPSCTHRQVLLSASVGTASTQKTVIDLWWNTTFLEANGEPNYFTDRVWSSPRWGNPTWIQLALNYIWKGRCPKQHPHPDGQPEPLSQPHTAVEVHALASCRPFSHPPPVHDMPSRRLWRNPAAFFPGGSHAFSLAEMDLSPPKLASRLDQANAKVILRHTHPHAESPRRRPPLKPRAEAANTSSAGGAASGAAEEGEGPPGTGTATNTATAAGAEARTGAAVLPAGEGGAESRPDGASAARSLPQDDVPADTGGRAGARGSSSNDSGEVGARNETSVSATSTAGGDSAGGGVAASGREVASEGTKPHCVTAAAAVAETEGVSLSDAQRMPASETNNTNQGAPADPSPALPGPSPDGMISPVWTFEGRTPSSKVGASGRAARDSQQEWARSKMWMGNQGMSPGATSTPTRSAPLKVFAPDDGLRDKRRNLQRRRSGSMDSQGGLTSAPTGTSDSMRGVVGGGATGWRGKTNTFAAGAVPARGETDSESDADLLAVRAPASASAAAFQGGGRDGGGSGPHGSRAPRRGPSFIQTEQWAIEMEMVFAQERRRWEE